MNFINKIGRVKQVLSDSRWWPFYLQRKFLAPATRHRIATLLATYFRPRKSLPLEFESDATQRIAEMRGAGISQLGQLLSAQQAAELHKYFLGKLVVDPYQSTGSPFLPQSSARHPDSHIAHHTAEDVIRAPYLFSIANSSRILTIVENLLGCKPTLSYIAAWWSYRTDQGAKQAEYFHRDVDDWRFIKLFIYLCNVDAQNGPHVYVKYSSKCPALCEIRRFTDEEVKSFFNSDQIIELKGNAGVGFLEDTFGIHKGQHVLEGTRLIFQAVYSMYPLPYGPKAPIMEIQHMKLEDGSYPDPWINRLYLR